MKRAVEVVGSMLHIHVSGDVRQLPLPPGKAGEVRAVSVSGDDVCVRTAKGRVYQWREYLVTDGVRNNAGGRWVLSEEGSPTWPTY